MGQTVFLMGHLHLLQNTAVFSATINKLRDKTGFKYGHVSSYGFPINHS